MVSYATHSQSVGLGKKIRAAEKNRDASTVFQPVHIPPKASWYTLRCHIKLIFGGRRRATLEEKIGNLQFVKSYGYMVG
jgi:hypothetical protein